MSKFKLGDRVNHSLLGNGTIIEETGDGVPLVEFDNKNELLHSGGGKSKDNKCYWCADNIITLILDDKKFINTFDADMFQKDLDSFDCRKSIKKDPFKKARIKIYSRYACVYIVYKCAGTSWPTDGRIYGVKSTKKAANDLKSQVQKKHPNDHIAVLTFKVDK